MRKEPRDDPDDPDDVADPVTGTLKRLFDSRSLFSPPTMIYNVMSGDLDWLHMCEEKTIFTV